MVGLCPLVTGNFFWLSYKFAAALPQVTGEFFWLPKWLPAPLRRNSMIFCWPPLLVYVLGHAGEETCDIPGGLLQWISYARECIRCYGCGTYDPPSKMPNFYPRVRNPSRSKAPHRIGSGRGGEESAIVMVTHRMAWIGRQLVVTTDPVQDVNLKQKLFPPDQPLWTKNVFCFCQYYITPYSCHKGRAARI